MATIESDMKVLREEVQQLSNRLIRFGLISLTILLALFLTISHFYGYLRNDETDEKIREAFELKRITGQDPDINDILLLLQDNLSVSEAPDHFHQGKTQFGPQQVEEARVRQSQLHDELDKVVLEALAQLNVEPVVFGIKLPVNLKKWALILPFLFLVSATYLSILLAKLRVLLAVAQHRLRTDIQNESTTLDRLLFGGSPTQSRSYALYPLQLQKVIYAFCVVCFLIYLWTIGGAVVFRGILAIFTVAFLQIFLIAAFYSFAYAHHVSHQLELQLSEITGEPSNNRITLFWISLRKLARYAAGSLSPRVTLPSGSLLILITLFLCIGLTASSCNKEAEPRRGSELALRRPGVFWYSASLPQDFVGGGTPDYKLNAIGRSVYLLSLTLAGFTLLFVPFLFYGRALNYGNQLNWIFRTSGIVPLFLTTDFAFNIPLFSGNLFVAKMILLGATLTLWWGLALYNSEKARNLWASSRRTLLILYIPIGFNAIFFLVWRQILYSCVFRRIVGTNSGPTWAPIPEPSWAVIPVDRGHLFRCNVGT